MDRAIKREVHKMRSAGKGWDADDLDRGIVGRAERRGLIAFALLATASVFGIPIGALALWTYLPQLVRGRSHATAVTRDAEPP